MTLSGCDKLAEILPAASCRPPAAFEALTGLNVTITVCVSLPNKAGEEIKKL